jgi:hypothetical protein
MADPEHWRADTVRHGGFGQRTLQQFGRGYGIIGHECEADPGENHRLDPVLACGPKPGMEADAPFAADAHYQIPHSAGMAVDVRLL